ncbi:MAG: hypothetical protein DSZ24_00475 [Thermodesulfatator sp.]|nr:MAG: hypothetical protein DSZ24_00475 [Thermodesulfatator sp.]
MLPAPSSHHQDLHLGPPNFLLRAETAPLKPLYTLPRLFQQEFFHQDFTSSFPFRMDLVLLYQIHTKNRIGKMLEPPIL